ncbi:MULTISPECIES: hypothetical protein [unclassified Herbaspirillum]|uniref:hypothetical protein n=1 Tax=unclassified Herbaspirillum TaxID=2624150 RepID=UPI000E2FC522|nr:MULTISPECIES: hypothetical protein [unclassified Herbaspirillum]RFB69910.1 hypothetical protein DZB54_14845 [Herbaspirillum sp. 3R-3a1]TFI07025.1 hypothetical protein E4P32_13955 [Herbaspirillum sp. 3R11]TFI12963.1 hypothetical protein E4P31_19080 [Herbaspirillum sp. 3R-11]TFI19204.1 hypothetical protein E4P30_25165 [Herbaspirillum sp. 3C11]
MKNKKNVPCGCHFEVPRNDGGGRYFINVVRMHGMLAGRINIGQITTATQKEDAFQFSYDLDQAAHIDSRTLLRIAIGQSISEHRFSYLSGPVFYGG